jgi:hypothetical protein
MTGGRDSPARRPTGPVSLAEDALAIAAAAARASR